MTITISIEQLLRWGLGILICCGVGFVTITTICLYIHDLYKEKLEEIQDFLGVLLAAFSFWFAVALIYAAIMWIQTANVQSMPT
jgi:hypothetical protein